MTRAEFWPTRTDETSDHVVHMGPSRLFGATCELVRIHGPQHRKCIKVRDGLGVRDPQGDQHSMNSGPKFRKNNSEKFLIFCFGGNLPLRKSSKNHFPMVRVEQIRSVSSFFFEIWALLKSFKNDVPMVGGKIKSQMFFKFFFSKMNP